MNKFYCCRKNLLNIFLVSLLYDLFPDLAVKKIRIIILIPKTILEICVRMNVNNLYQKDRKFISQNLSQALRLLCQVSDQN